MTGTKLRAIPRDAFSNLRALRSLDLRNNALEEINITALDVSSLRHVHLAGKNRSQTKRLYRENKEDLCREYIEIFEKM